MGRLRPSVVRDLDLRDPRSPPRRPGRPRVRAGGRDGRAITLWADQARTVEGLRSWSAADADAWPGFDRLVRSLGQFLAELAAQTPPDIKAPGLGDAIAGLKLGRTFRGLGKHDAHTILRVLPMAVADFVAEAFETDALRAAIAWRGVRHSFLGPWSAGSTAILLGDSAGTDGGAAGQTVFAIGGPGALSEALAGAIRGAGGEIRCGAEVVSITARDNRVTGVVLASGEEIAATAVVSGAGPEADARRPRRSGDARPDDALASRQLPDAGRGREGQPRRRSAAALHRGRGRRRAAPPRPDPRRARHRCDRAGLRRREVRSVVGHAGPRGDDPVARRPVARRGRAGRDARDERDGAVRAAAAARRRVGRGRPGGRVRRSGRRASSTGLRPASRRASAPAR